MPLHHALYFLNQARKKSTEAAPVPFCFDRRPERPFHRVSLYLIDPTGGGR